MAAEAAGDAAVAAFTSTKPRKSGPSVRTDELLQLIRTQHARERSCVFVPCWLAAILTAAVAGWIHAAPGLAGPSELPALALVATVDPASAGYPMAGPQDVLPWLQSALLPALLPNGDALTTSIPHLRLVGGVRVSQWRAVAGACSGSGAGSSSANTAGGLSAALGMDGGCVAPDTGSPLLSGRWVEGSGGSSTSTTAAATTATTATTPIGDVTAALQYLNGTGFTSAIACGFRPLGTQPWLAPAGATAQGVLGAGYHVLLTGSPDTSLPLPLPGPGTGAPAPAGPASDAMDALAAGAWTDPYTTAYVRVEALGFNPSAGRWVGLAWDLSFPSHGTATVRPMVASAAAGPAAFDGAVPSGLQPLVPLLQYAVVLLALVLAVQGALGAAASLASLLNSCRRALAGSSAVTSTSSTRPAALPSKPFTWSWSWLGWLINLGCAVALWTCVTSWSATVAGLEATRALATANAGVLLDGAGESPADACFGEPGSDPASASLLLHVTLGAAFDAQAQWRKAAGASIALLVLRTLRLVSLQPRMAVLLEALASSASDLAHFGLIFLLLLFGHAVWAGLAFGSQAPDFATIPSGLFSLVRMAMFDYSLEPLMAQDSTGASVFYTTFMLGVTHIVLWTWLGIALETYSTARNAATERPRLPTLADDVHAGVLNGPAALADLAHSITAQLQSWTGGRDKAAGRAAAQLEGILGTPVRRSTSGSSSGPASGDGAAAAGQGAGAVPRIPRSLMLRIHARVLSAVERHAATSAAASSFAASALPPTIFVSDVAVSLGIPETAAKAVLQHYVAGDDISPAARHRLVLAVMGRGFNSVEKEKGSENGAGGTRGGSGGGEGRGGATGSDQGSSSGSSRGCSSSGPRAALGSSASASASATTTTTADEWGATSPAGSYSYHAVALLPAVGGQGAGHGSSGAAAADQWPDAHAVPVAGLTIAAPSGSAGQGQGRSSGDEEGSRRGRRDGAGGGSGAAAGGAADHDRSSSATAAGSAAGGLVAAHSSGSSGDLTATATPSGSAGLPSSPLALHHGSKYTSVGRMMVRKPSGSGMRILQEDGEQ